jgi:hypothetical protein
MNNYVESVNKWCSFQTERFEFSLCFLIKISGKKPLNVTDFPFTYETVNSFTSIISWAQP